MNVLALHDIHGNVDALDAVLADAPEPDAILVGDAVPGAFGAATLDRLAGARCVWGNGEREVAAAGRRMLGAGRTDELSVAAAPTSRLSAIEVTRWFEERA